ncbi:prion-inhibition propagation domain-containing protein [Fusarium pseudoanthophilum]|uniref:Prion-inhibition propagation domain-containing protein n=1 Tax=Fusarium pseudoanthophilum TaxID=48495 RepID=A0A8H5KAG8_9HYPO|nr:prion-inhibition propagation domain-containing protein [Fusarium pseudoanthophilum]
MAEVFGVVSGAIGVTAIFKQCVECFEYIQLGRHFSRDFGRYRLKLKIAKRRLARWGEAVSIDENPRLTAPEPDDTLARAVKAILEEIVLLFQTINKSSKRYEIKVPKEDLECLGDENLEPVFQRLDAQWATVSRPRQKEPSFIKKTAWALYDAKNFEKLIEQVSGFVDDLENLFPAEEANRRQLVQKEIEDISDEESLVILQQVAAGTDQLLADAATERVMSIDVRNYAREIKGEEKTKIRLGNDWSDSALGATAVLNERTINETGSVSARGSSTVHVGNRYGSF